MINVGLEYNLLNTPFKFLSKSALDQQATLILIVKLVVKEIVIPILKSQPKFDSKKIISLLEKSVACNVIKIYIYS